MTVRDWVGEFLERYDRMDAILVKAGFPATSRWWRREIEHFLRTGRRRWIIRAGRRAGKSSTLCRLATAWALWGPWFVPAGDTPVIAFVSVSLAESASRLTTIKAILSALEMPAEQSGDTVETRRGVVFKTFACTLRGTVGFTGILVIGDECSRWESKELSANPARDVVGSLAPTLATQPHGFMVLSSSPWATDDFHHECFEQGNTDFQCVSYAPTWIAHVELTEEFTHELEPNEKTWSREYAAIPTEDLVTNNWWGDSALALAFTNEPSPTFNPNVRYWIGVDPAFSSDRFGWAVVSNTRPPLNHAAQDRAPGRIIRVHECGAWKPDRSPREMARKLKAEVCARYNVNKVWSDQYHGSSWQQLAGDVGLRVEIFTWKGGDAEDSKATLYKRAQTGMLSNEWRIPRAPDLVREFKSTRGVLLPSGGERIEVPRSVAGHGDRVSAIVLASSMSMTVAPQLVDPSPWERRERERNMQQLAAIFGWAPNIPLPPTPAQGAQAELTAMLRAVAPEASRTWVNNVACLLLSPSAAISVGYMRQAHTNPQRRAELRTLLETNGADALSEIRNEFPDL